MFHVICLLFYDDFLHGVRDTKSNTPDVNVTMSTTN